MPADRRGTEGNHDNRKRHEKLGWSTPHRKPLLRNLVTPLLDRERIETTDAKAKELRRVADRMIELSSGRIVSDGPPPGGKADIGDLQW